jgi:hypothetical protein
MNSLRQPLEIPDRSRFASGHIKQEHKIKQQRILSLAPASHQTGIRRSREEKENELLEVAPPPPKPKVTIDLNLD